MCGRPRPAGAAYVYMQIKQRQFVATWWSGRGVGNPVILVNFNSYSQLAGIYLQFSN
jgi:hypothetical protein